MRSWHEAKANFSWSTVASSSGVVRVLPTGLVYSPMRKRYQYQVSGSRPRASAWTLWPNSAAAGSVPSLTIFVNAWSEATSHSTAWSDSPMPPNPDGSTRSVVRRVQRMTEVGSGSPDATPRRKGSVSMPSAGGASVGCGIVVVVLAFAALVVVVVPLASSPSVVHAPSTIAPPVPARSARKRRRWSSTRSERSRRISSSVVTGCDPTATHRCGGCGVSVEPPGSVRLDTTSPCPFPDLTR